MCISTEALAFFLTLIAAPVDTSEPGLIVVGATAGDVHWVAVEDNWCTSAPQQES